MKCVETFDLELSRFIRAPRQTSMPSSPFLAPMLAYVEAMPEGGELLAAARNVRRAQAAIRSRASCTNTEPPRG